MLTVLITRLKISIARRANLCVRVLWIWNDNMAMDMESGELHIVSSWDDDDE